MRFSTGFALAVNIVGFLFAAILLVKELDNPNPDSTYIATTGVISFMTAISIMGIVETDY